MLEWAVRAAGSRHSLRRVLRFHAGPLRDMALYMGLLVYTRERADAVRGAAAWRRGSVM